VLEGSALGFVVSGQAPHVLHVEENTVLQQAGVQPDDMLYKVNDTEVLEGEFSKQDIIA
jgi:hypothetical protein